MHLFVSVFFACVYSYGLDVRRKILRLYRAYAIVISIGRLDVIRGLTKVETQNLASPVQVCAIN